MPTVIRDTTIGAPAGLIWEILVGLDRCHEWEPGYVSSRYTSDRRTGVGATRRVELKSPMGVRHADHVVTRWDEPAAIAWKATDSNFPFLRAAEQTILLTSQGDSTAVRNQLAYELGYGPLGTVVDKLMFRRTVEGAADGFLTSLAARATGSRD